MENAQEMRNISALAPDLWQVTPASLASHLSEGRWVGAKHLLYISKIISHAIYDGLVNGIQHQIAISIPPRHGKSELLSVWTPVWVLNTWPWANIILASYGSDLSTDFSRKSRDLIVQHESSLNVNLRKDKRQVDRWMTTDNGGVFAVGVGGPITGRGANVLIIDDYIKNAKEADSKAQRKVIFEWFKSTALTRREPGCPTIIIATRWHPEDLIGKLAEIDGPPWRTVVLPALAEPTEDVPDLLGRQPGEALWPERYSKQALLNIKATVGTYFWNSLYKNKPTASKAGVFKGDDLQIIDIPPAMATVRIVRAWDLASTPDEDTGDPDWTVGLKMVYDDNTKMYTIIDIVRQQLSPLGVEELIKNIARADGPDVPIYIELEPGSAGKNVIALIAKYTVPGYAVKGIRATGPKFIRAQSVMAGIENGLVRQLRAPWNSTLIDEIDTFPSEGSHDDQIDAMSLAHWALSTMVMGKLAWGQTYSQEMIEGDQGVHTGVVWGRR